MKLSKAKQEELYNQIHEDVMQARIKISQLLKYNDAGKQIDDILSDLNRFAPENAVQLFGKKPEPKKQEYPEYKEFTRIWDERYHEVGFDMPKDGQKIKSIIRKIQMYLRSANADPSEKNTVDFWQAFVNTLWKTWGHGKNLSTIDSHLTALIFEMKHGKRTNSYITQPSAKRIIDSL